MIFKISTETDKPHKKKNMADTDKTYTITSTDGKSFTATAESIAWTENGEFILLMVGEETKHVIVAANVVAVTEK